MEQFNNINATITLEKKLNVIVREKLTINDPNNNVCDIIINLRKSINDLKNKISKNEELMKSKDNAFDNLVLEIRELKKSLNNNILQIKMINVDKKKYNEYVIWKDAYEQINGIPVPESNGGDCVTKFNIGSSILRERAKLELFEKQESAIQYIRGINTKLHNVKNDLEKSMDEYTKNKDINRYLSNKLYKKIIRNQIIFDKYVEDSMHIYNFLKNMVNDMQWITNIERVFI